MQTFGSTELSREKSLQIPGKLRLVVEQQYF
jgi:hypothetical protein